MDMENMKKQIQEAFDKDRTEQERVTIRQLGGEE